MGGGGKPQSTPCLHSTITGAAASYHEGPTRSGLPTMPHCAVVTAAATATLLLSTHHCMMGAPQPTRPPRHPGHPYTHHPLSPAMQACLDPSPVLVLLDTHRLRRLPLFGTYWLVLRGKERNGKARQHTQAAAVNPEKGHSQRDYHTKRPAQKSCCAFCEHTASASRRLRPVPCRKLMLQI